MLHGTIFYKINILDFIVYIDTFSLQMFNDQLPLAVVISDSWGFFYYIAVSNYSEAHYKSKLLFGRRIRIDTIR